MALRLRRQLVLLALAALLATPLWPASAARAADDSNIPGVPLPGPVVTGRLGGPIYDHVYAIDVPPARVIALTLSGDAGPNFGLYLFDASATTVYGTAGQVAVSALPGPNQSIRYGTVGGGRFYIDLNGASNTGGSFRLVVAIASDTTPPHLSLSLDGGAAATNHPNVTVTLAASDDLSGVKDVQFSFDGRIWGIWQPFAPTWPWLLPTGDGRRQLWARVRDGAGNLSAVATASIVLDTVPPLVLARSPVAGGSTFGLQPTFTVTFSEPIDIVSWLDAGLLVQDPAGTVLHGTYAVDARTNTGSFTPNGSLSPGGLYTVTLGDVRDLAGNPTPSLGGWLVQARMGHIIALSAAPAIASASARATLQGLTDPGVGGPLLLEESVAAGPWGAVATLQQDPSGAFGTSVPVIGTTAFRVHFVGSATEADSYSPVVRVLVRRAVKVAVSPAAIPDTLRVGWTVRITAILNPPAPDVTVTLVVQRYDSRTAGWQQLSSAAARSARGTATFAWRPQTAGRYRLRVTTPSSALYANGISVTSWTVA